MFSKQNPGQRGNAGVGEGGAVGFLVVVVVVGRGLGVGYGVVVDRGAGLVTQQLSSPGQCASESMSSQNSANNPLTHSPRHGLNAGGGLDGAIVLVVGGVRLLFLSMITRFAGVSSPYESRDTQQRKPALHNEETSNTASQ